MILYGRKKRNKCKWREYQIWKFLSVRADAKIVKQIQGKKLFQLFLTKFSSWLRDSGIFWEMPRLLNNLHL